MSDFKAANASFFENIDDLIKQYLDVDSWHNLSNEAKQISERISSHGLIRIFATVPRKVKNNPLISLDFPIETGGGRLPLYIQEWPLVRVIRVWMLMHIPGSDKESYQKLIGQLFKYSEMEELVALYSALPVYHYPQCWTEYCTEGIRSNIEPVRHAVISHNAYPEHFIDEGAWNQLVLKAFFTGEHIPDIIGVQRRNNQHLAGALVDYAYERAAAKREINPMLWVLVTPYVEERAYAIMSQRLRDSENLQERKAIAHAFSKSEYKLAAEFLNQQDELKELINPVGTLWETWG